MEKYLNIIKNAYSGYWNYLKNEIININHWDNYFYGLILISIIVWGLEIIFPWRKNQSIFRKDFWLDTFYMFFNFFLLNLIILIALTETTSTFFNDILGVIGLSISSFQLFNVNALPLGLGLLIFFLVSDFTQWNAHRLLHRIPWLWNFHKVHHSVKEMGFAAHLRYHWMEPIVYKSILYIPIAIIGGFNAQHVAIVHFFAITVGHLNHANLGWDYGILKYVFNNPKMHIWHHAKALPKNQKYGVNYGLTLSVWDYLFKTNYVPRSGRDIELGFKDDEHFPKDFISQEIYPLKKMKYLTFLIITILLTSCCSTKQVIKNTTKEAPKTINKDENEVTVEAEKTPIVTEVKFEAEEETETEIEIEDTGKSEAKIPLPPKPPKPALKQSEIFNHTRWNKLLQKNVTKSGVVNYNAFKNNPSELSVYIDYLGENMPNKSWSKQDKLAYWINAYNAMTIDLIVKNYPLKSIKDIKEPWEQRFWQLGNKWYNLNEIEHQILRKMNEPRIHFAIVCASFSCPKLQNEAFTASTLETQLTKATKEFLIDSKRNNITENNLRLSKIFKWFKKDFEKNGSLIDFLNLYSEVKISANAKKTYLNYNWALND